MTSSVKTIFLAENEKNIFDALKSQGIDTKVFENKLADLFNRVYNNFVGYYIFQQNDTIYKLIVLPKTISQDVNTKEKGFVNYLLHYYRVNLKYEFDETRNISDSLLSLAFKDNNADKNSHLPLDEFEFYKYKSILDEIEKFFKKHKNYKRVNVDYSSQSIKYKLNLQKNIKELDKTKIHQIQTIDMMYSQIATIAHNALKLFIAKRLKSLDDKYKEKLISQSKKLNSLIAKKYNIDKNYKLTLSKLNSFKIIKIFNSTKETKQLLVSIKSLFGFEQMYQDNEVSVENRYDLTTTSFFIDPILFYEWYVYDILKTYADAENMTILFDKHKDERKKTATKYLLTNKDAINNDKTSNPDYVIIDDETKVKVVIDAKWKNIEKVGEIASSDYLKLQFDSSLLTKNSYVTTSNIIYPNLAIGNSNLSVTIDNESVFNFSVLEIDMNFDKDKNSLDFIYDSQELAENISKNKKIETLKSTSEQLSEDINTHRTEIITKLLNQESLEDKEDILTELDDRLLVSANKLNENIEEKISPKIEALLKVYDDILEDDSKKFLKSSSSIYNYYKDKQYEHFDYSMPGSGLWKLIELELNTSFSWFLRIKSNVCNISCPWTNISNSRRSITQDLDNGKKVKLNQHEHNDTNKLQGLMLGGVDLLLHDNGTLDEFSDVSNLDINFFTNELAAFVRSIKDLRNEHAHIKAMSLEKFEELDSLLFSSTNDLSNIQKLLEFKKVIREYIL